MIITKSNDMHKLANNKIAANKKKSLSLLNEKALNEALRVAILLVQKLIKTKEVKPINSHPNKNIIKLPAKTINTIETTNNSIKSKSLVIRGSYLK